VQFVISRPKDTPFTHVTSTMAIRSDGSTVMAGACSHHRVSLLATRAGETAVIALTTALPPLAPGEHSSAQPLPPVAPGTKTRDVRVRPLHVGISISQTSRDKEPIVAISTSWAGPETNQRVFSAFAPSTAPVPTATGLQQLSKF
jgi:hypothetical protein